MVHLNQLLLVMRTISNKIVPFLVGIFVLLTSTSCKSITHYRVGEYLNDLAYSTGVNLNLNEEDSFNSLKEYGIVEEKDNELINEDLRIDYLKRTVNSFLNDESKTSLILLDVFNETKDKRLVSKEEAKEIIDKLVDEINNQTFEERTIIIEKDNVIYVDDLESSDLDIGDVIYDKDDEKYKKLISKSQDGYKFKDADIEDVYSQIDIAGQYEVNFDDAEIIDLTDNFENINFSETDSSYSNDVYNLLASKRQNFKKDGYNISYTINSESIDFRISKSIDKGLTMFFDTSLSSIKPTYKWDDSGESLYAFFKVDFDLTNEIGVSTGKYNNYYLDLKDEKADSLLAHLKKLNTKDDVLEATIPICTIKTPIPSIPTATFNIDVLAKFYLSGKAEILLQNNGVIGFELKDKKFRVIHDVEKDYDFILGASARSVAGLNFNICTLDYRLMDVELDAGIRAAITPTLHLIDDEGYTKDEYVDEEYYALYEATKDNSNVSLCGDLTLNWVLDINLNSSKTLLYKYGFSRNKTILDKSDQVFGNLTHIEHFQFVKKCSQKGKKRIIKKENVTSINSDKIILDKYSLVIIKGKEASIPIKSLPNGYSLYDLRYETNKAEVVTINNNGIIQSKDIGNCKITIKTKDDKFKAYLNVLVSTG